MIGKIEPSIAIRGELRFFFPEVEFIEVASVVFANLHGYEILIGQPIDN
jgi:hypothetical protein